MTEDIIDITHFRKERIAHNNGRDIKSYEEMQKHYLFRLKERYNIEITNKEYDDLLLNMTNSNFILVYKLSYRKCLVWVKIKDVYVLTVFYGQSKDGGIILRPPCFVTCLNLNKNNKIPVPKLLGINGYNSIDFENECDNILKEIFKLQNDYCEMGKTNFFKYHKASMDFKAIVHYWNKGGEIKILYIIRCLINKLKENNKNFKLITH